MKTKLSLSRHARFLRNLPMLGVFTLGLALTIFSIFINEQHHRKSILEHARRDAIEYLRLLQEGTHAYEHVNRDVAGLFAASDSVTAREFDVYVKSVNALETHPGLGYIGYIRRVAIDSSARFEAEARKDFPAYKIQGPHPDAGFAYPLTYAFPHDDRIMEAIGRDFSGIPERWAAMQKARDLGKSIATGKHAYLKTPLKESIVFIFTPIYDFGKPIETITQRRAALTGFVYSAFVVDEVISGAMGARFKALFDLEIYDGEVDHDHILYDGDSRAHVLEKDAFLVAHQENVDFAGRNWALYFYPKPDYFQKYPGNSDTGLSHQN